MGSGIAFRKTEEKDSAGGFVKQSVDKLISSIDDIDYEFLHLFVVETRHLRPGDRAIWTVHQNIRAVTRSRTRRNARVQILQNRVPEALEDDELCKPLLQHRLRNQQS